MLGETVVKLLPQDIQSRTVLIHADISPADAASPAERRPPMQHTVVVDGCDKTEDESKCGRASHGGTILQSTVPGVSWTQYSESGLVRSLFHVLIASYLDSMSVSLPVVSARVSCSPYLHLFRLQVAHHASVGVIPSHVDEFLGCRVVL